MTQLFAQSHEFSIYGGSGWSPLRYQLSLGDRSGGMGGDFGVGYTWFLVKEKVTDTEYVFHERWGMHTGIGLGLYNAKAKLNNVETIRKDLRDDEGDRFDLYTTIAGYSETQKTMFLNIPVMALFQINQFYVMGGVKAGIPLRGKYSSKDATLTNVGDYIDYDNKLETQTFAGYGSFRGKNSEGDLKLGVFVMLALEAGMNWRISDKLLLYAGAYFDYGLNNAFKGKRMSFVNYNSGNPENFTTNSVLSSYTDDGKLSTFTDKVNMMSVGIKLRLAFSYPQGGTTVVSN